MPKILIDSGPSKGSISPLYTLGRCPRLYFYTYEYPRLLGTNWLDFGRQQSRQPLVRGSLAHVGLAHYYAQEQALQLGTDPDAYYSPMEAIVLAAKDWRTGADHIPIVQKSVKQYIAAYANYDDFEILFIEAPVDYTVGGKFKYQQKPDLVKRRSGRIKPVDHKTSTSPGKRLFRIYSMDLKVQAYQYWGPQIYGEAFDGLEINLIGMGKDTHLRGVPTPTPAMLAEFENQVFALEAEKAWRLEMQADLVQQGKDARLAWRGANHEQVCVSRYGECEFIEACAWGQVGQGDPLERDEIGRQLQESLTKHGGVPELNIMGLGES